MQHFLSFAMRLVRALSEHFWLITAVVFVTSAVGWHQYLAANAFDNQAANQHTVWDTIAFTIMLAPLRYPLVHGQEVPFLLNVGRVLLPFMFVGGIFKVTVLRTAAEKHVNQWFARTFSQHAVVCGLSQAGFALVCELLRGNRWVVLIDPKGPPALLSRLQQALATMPRAIQHRFALIEGDATSTEVLRMAGAQHAKEIYAVTDDDYTNLDIATAAQALGVALRPGAPAPQIHVHFKDYLMRDPLKDNLKLFDSRALAGRQIVNQYPADAPWLAGRDLSKAPHAMLIGLGSLGEQVALQLARTAHYACGQRMHITIVDAKASEAGKGLLQRYPMLDPSITPAHFGMPGDAGNCMSLPVVGLRLVQASIDAFCHDGFAAECAQWGIPGAIYLCLGNDIETDRIARALVIALERSLHEGRHAPASTPHCTIVKAMRRLTQMKQKQNEPYPAKPVGLGNVGVVEVDVLRTAAAAVVTDDLEDLAKRTHDAYLTYSQKHNVKTADSRPWQTLDDEARQMNLNTTDHHLVRLREMGVSVTAKDLVKGRLPLPPEQFELAEKFLLENHEAFAAAEHRRWVCDKLFFGWRYMQGDKNNKAAKLNCSLVGYESLTDDVKQYDRDNAERALALIQGQ